MSQDQMMEEIVLKFGHPDLRALHAEGFVATKVAWLIAENVASRAGGVHLAHHTWVELVFVAVVTERGVKHPPRHIPAWGSWL